MSDRNPEQVTVLIVDDHAVVRQGVRGYLEAQDDITVCGEASSGEEATRLAAEHTPDVVLMDLVMPGMNGVAATRQVRLVSPDSQVIVLTSYHDDDHIFPAIEAGALSYLLKDVGPDELAAAVRLAKQGKSVLHSPVAIRVLQEVRGIRTAPETTTARSAAQPLVEPLSERELEVLELIAAGYTNSEIAGRLYITRGTVKRHNNNIYRKLEVRHRAAAIARARDLSLL